MTARDRLIVALDLPTPEEAELMVNRLGNSVTLYKVGLQVYCQQNGPALVRWLLGEKHKRVMLDLKLHDIPNTVQKAVEAISKMGVEFTTVHAYVPTMAAAVAGRSGQLKLLAVTVLTSMNQNDLVENGYSSGLPITQLVLMRAGQAAGTLGGVVCSPREVSMVKKAYPKLLTVVPGIRFSPELSRDDQKRTATPYKAICDGADYLVVGRPITQAADPSAAAELIIAEMMSARSFPNDEKSVDTSAGDLSSGSNS